jgi:hypothetical protein
MDKYIIIEEIEKIQLDIHNNNFLGCNEYDLHLREDIAEYIIKNFELKPIK